MRTEDAARQAAEAARYRAGVRPGPADVFAAIRRLGIRLLRYPLPEDSAEGAYVRSRGAAYILVSTAYARSHQRFTAAHELGHHFLTPDRDDLEHYDDKVDAGADRAANLFAGYFLIDEASARETVGGISDPVAKALVVTHRFEVSLPAAAIHLCDLGLIRAVDKGEVLRLAMDPSASINGLRRARGLPAVRQVEARGETDPGEEYVAILARMARLGVIPPDRIGELGYDRHIDVESDEFEIAQPPAGGGRPR